MWLSHSPRRPFGSRLSETILKRIEKKDISWEKYNDLEPADLGQLINNPHSGKQLYKMIHQFPQLELSAHVEPITRSMMKVDLVVTPDFEFAQDRRFVSQETYVSFTMPLFEPLAQLYYIKVISDIWIHCESSLPVSFHNLILPQKNAPPPTELLDLQPLL
ncbi:hypothetical protein PsorP6_006525 [Peronosclerospora sorghi]|uniref:Uncharacterized protein n=1 Tax=Peronosclerospora sorghi TaxID=230839 RepID=A0ACC0W3D7_9STRA|nr:hypothetical protein PsorP6_006525 [Peronosclerospora sorghi]